MYSILPKINEISRGPWQTQLAAVLLLLASLLLVLSIVNQSIEAYQLSKLDDKVKQEISSSSAVTKGNSVKTILNAPIFGKHQPNAVERVNTTLNLSGIVNSTKSDQRLAFISQPDEDVSVYREGDEITNGLKLQKIYDDKVTLLRFGALETLYIDWEKIDSNNGASSLSYKPKTSQSKVSRSNVSKPVKRPTFDREQYLEKMRERFKDGKFNGGKGRGMFRGMGNFEGINGF
jgi:type II secretory pathway component PulC